MQELLLSQTKNIHRSSKRKSYSRTGAFHNKFNNGQAQFKFKATTAVISRQG